MYRVTAGRKKGWEGGRGLVGVYYNYCIERHSTVLSIHNIGKEMILFRHIKLMLKLRVRPPNDECK